MIGKNERIIFIDVIFLLRLGTDPIHHQHILIHQEIKVIFTVLVLVSIRIFHRMFIQLVSINSESKIRRDEIFIIFIFIYSRDASDGATQPPMLSFKMFLAEQDDNIDEEKAGKRYTEYKNDFKKTQIAEFFAAHKDEDWFVLI